MAVNKSGLSLGPLLFNWETNKARDFYFKIADESPVDTVYLGEVVCSKRQPFHDVYIPEVVERLQSAGKKVILSTLILVMTKRELKSVEDIASMGDDILIEANDMSAISLLKGKNHAVGPFINIYNEAALKYFERNGATRISLPFELSGDSLRAIAKVAESQLEVQVFGRLPLAISARCYHARYQNKQKDNCQYVCDQDTNGLTINTVDGQDFLAINGLQTMSNSYCNLANEIGSLKEMGINNFRLSPHDTDMIKISSTYRDFIDDKISAEDLEEVLEDLLPEVDFSNGFYYKQAGLSKISA
ncbi:U32 family peptidase [Rickettsiales bacterium]|nr:U32 family peptidase [Rickettsiales bacterium]